jgi:RNA recognition motif-containing protein
MAEESPEAAQPEASKYEAENWSNAITIYVGNLGFRETEADVRKLFEPFGRILTISLMRRGGGHDFSGTAFVVMSSRDEGVAAMEKLNGTTHNDLRLTVEEARQAYDPSYRRPHRRREDETYNYYYRRSDGRRGSPRRSDDRRESRRRDDDRYGRGSSVYESRGRESSSRRRVVDDRRTRYQGRNRDSD